MLKKRILYNKEIISLRRIVNNNFLDELYSKNTIFPLETTNIYSKHFKNLPTIMILINFAIPFISYYYLLIISK